MSKNNDQDWLYFISFGIGFTGYGLCFMFFAYVFRYFVGQRDVSLSRASVGLMVGIVLIIIFKKISSRK